MNSDELSGSVIVCCEAPSSGQQEVCGATIQITVSCPSTIQTGHFQRCFLIRKIHEKQLTKSCFDSCMLKWKKKKHKKHFR